MTTEQQTYDRLHAKANERAQRRFRAALNDERWDVPSTNLYLQAEALVDRLAIGPCPGYCPSREGGDHDHS